MQFLCVHSAAGYRKYAIRELERFLPDVLSCNQNSTSFFQLALDRFYDPLQKTSYSGNSQFRVQDKISQYLSELLQMYLAEYMWADAEKMLIELHDRRMLHSSFHLYDFFYKTNRCYEGALFLKKIIPLYRAKSLDVQHMESQRQRLMRVQPTPWSKPKRSYKPRPSTKAKKSKEPLVYFLRNAKGRRIKMSLEEILGIDE